MTLNPEISTADRTLLPNLIVPGGQKCGSTSLAAYISYHPDCYLSSPKEPSFFSRYGNIDDLSSYQKHFDGYAGQRVLFEASTGYLFEPYAARRISETLPDDTKFVIILRRPVDRAISAYLHLKKRFDDRRDIAEALSGLPQDPIEAFTEEARRIIFALRAGLIDPRRYQDRYDDCLWQFRYLQNSWYIDSIRRYLELFGRDRVLVVFLEQLEKDPQRTMAGVFEFLGVAEFSDERFARKTNPTRMPPGISHLRRTGRGPYAAIAKRYPQIPTQIARRLRARTDHSGEDGLKELRAGLSAILTKQYSMLGQLLERDIEAIWCER